MSKHYTVTSSSMHCGRPFTACPGMKRSRSAQAGWSKHTCTHATKDAAAHLPGVHLLLPPCDAQAADHHRQAVTVQFLHHARCQAEVVRACGAAPRPHPSRHQINPLVPQETLTMASRSSEADFCVSRSFILSRACSIRSFLRILASMAGDARALGGIF